MGNESRATNQAKVSVCHCFYMGNGTVPEKGQRGVIQQSCDTEPRSEARQARAFRFFFRVRTTRMMKSEPSITANTPECLTY